MVWSQLQKRIRLSLLNSLINCVFFTLQRAELELPHQEKYHPEKCHSGKQWHKSFYTATGLPTVGVSTLILNNNFIPCLCKKPLTYVEIKAIRIYLVYETPYEVGFHWLYNLHEFSKCFPLFCFFAHSLAQLLVFWDQQQWELWLQLWLRGKTYKIASWRLLLCPSQNLAIL